MYVYGTDRGDDGRVEAGEAVGQEVLLLHAAPLRAHHQLAQPPHLCGVWEGSSVC